MNRQLHTQEDLHAVPQVQAITCFAFVFSDKKDLLGIYNAVNGTDYDTPEELEVNTLENVLYLSMKNDLSFLIDTELNLYEHQSTCNPNMPMRGFLYFGISTALISRSGRSISTARWPRSFLSLSISSSTTGPGRNPTEDLKAFRPV